MADPYQRFVEQYKENCNTYVRRAPVRLLGLLLALPVAIVLASAGALLSRLTGEPLAAGVVIFVGAIAYLIGWIAVARLLEAPAAPLPMYPPSHYPPPHDVGPSPFAIAPGYPPAPNYVGSQFAAPTAPPWQQPVPSATPARSGGGCVLVALGTFGVLVLSCCGGGIVLSRFAVVHAGPANQPFQAGAPFPGDPFADMQRQQQRQIDEMIQRQNDHWRQIEQDRERIGRGPGW
jgi:hypothetical protein